MGKPTGFMEYQRELPQDRPPQERIQNWQEFHEHLEDEKLEKQACRCMDCGVPFCHTGTLISGMASGCPINNLIPEWNDLVYRGLWKQALERLHKTNNFPDFTGRVCPAPCEGSCVLGITDPPVAIKNIECAIVEKGFEQGWIKPKPPQNRTGKNVAVIGSGPSGLSCAAQLNKSGHYVTVYERADRIGGLLMYGIPNMKLDKSVVQRRIDLLAHEGINFVTNTVIGDNFPATKLRNENDAIVLCCGATKPRDLTIQGRQLNGIHFAIDFLHQNTKYLLDHNFNGTPSLSARNKHVIVIGGGDTGTDCIATAIRHHCKSVTQFEILPRPPAERKPDNPWPEWPKIYRLDYGQQEAAAQFGSDPRRYLIMTEKFSGDDNGQVKALHTINIEWTKDGNKGLIPRKIPGSEKNWPADLVLLAMGFLGPEDAILDELTIERDARSNVKTKEGSYATNIEGVFAAGDMRRGQSLVVWAIQEGRAAAQECDRFLIKKQIAV